MTRDETKGIIALMATAYPNFTATNKTMLIDSWHMFLEPYSYTDAVNALKIYVKTSNSGFAPSVSQLIAEIGSIQEKPELTDAQAWALVQNALCNSSYNSKSEFEKLPEAVQQAVGSHEQLKVWAQTENLNHTVVSSNVQRAYRSIIENMKKREVVKVALEYQQQMALE